VIDKIAFHLNVNDWNSIKPPPISRLDYLDILDLLDKLEKAKVL